MKADEDLSEGATIAWREYSPPFSPTGCFQAAWQLKVQLLTPLNTSSLAETTTAKTTLAYLWNARRGA